jgi:hypothetical protein
LPVMRVMCLRGWMVGARHVLRKKLSQENKSLLAKVADLQRRLDDSALQLEVKTLKVRVLAWQAVQYLGCVRCLCVVCGVWYVVCVGGRGGGEG